MKRAELIRRIKRQGCVLIRHGARHDWYQNPNTKVSQPIPRHREVAIDVIHKTMDIFGGLGTDKEMPVEKHIRDIYTAPHGMNTAEINYIKGGLAL